MVGRGASPRLSFSAGPMVRILFPPAKSQQTFIHFVPDLPFSWFDDPPAPNRLIALLWLGKPIGAFTAVLGSIPRDK